MSQTLRVGIIMDAWKKPILLRHLSQAGFTTEPLADAPAGSVGLAVHTDEPLRLADVVRAANTEARETQRSPSVN